MYIPRGGRLDPRGVRSRYVLCLAVLSSQGTLASTEAKQVPHSRIRVCLPLEVVADKGIHVGMQFNSLYFLIFFLPVTLAGYYLLGRKVRERGGAEHLCGTGNGSSFLRADWFLIIASLVFYGVANVWYPVMLAVLILVNWFIARKASPAGSQRPTPLPTSGTEGELEEDHSAGETENIKNSDRLRKRWMVLGVVFNVGVLGVFKYTNFFLENLNALLKTDLAMVNLFLPLGISFIIFSQISWIVDCYRGSLEQPVSFREYALYSVFFPKITQGPITTMRDFLPQLRSEKRGSLDSSGMVIGIQMFTCGLFKKLVLADPLGTVVTTYYSNFSYRSNVDSLIVMLAYTFQIYMDFSGYSDMALGVARMLGFELPANFNSPYRAGSVTDFWRRWHISLSTFLREYVYFPLGGSRKGKLRTYVNIMVVFLVSGIWHGANWTFILWGVLHGLAQVIERFLGKLYQKVWLPIRWAITFYVTSMLWMLFQSDSYAEFQRFRWHLTVDKSGYYSSDLAKCFHITGVRAALSMLHLPCGDAAVGWVCTAIFLGGCMTVCLLLPNNQKRKYRVSAGSLLVTLGMLIICLLSMSGVSSFIYNDF